ncbi:hypothetical protein [Burkholderia cenocepacia]|uniref:hypothetical protein n=1 Tax=Burkholderia cenocepacia TaxID=95486 RepID=UPI000F58BD7A|nr:hypothetical protein [Burkholderia cenocepacia]
MGEHLFAVTEDETARALLVAAAIVYRDDNPASVGECILLAERARELIIYSDRSDVARRLAPGH